MQIANLISVSKGAIALEKPDNIKSYLSLKKCEAETLQEFCKLLIHVGCDLAELDGYYIGYSIKQISKEFDLLRFGTDFVLNIELKSE